ncbi:MAG: histone deacetylase [Chitinispirillaceae bacterium]|nr:histone deacetylase [Chitinispirillaceae bacterium]
MAAISRREFLARTATAGLGLAAVHSCTMVNSLAITPTTGLFYDPACLQHPVVGTDDPRRLSWIYDRFAASGILEQVETIQPLSIEETRSHAALVHSQETLDLLDQCPAAGPGALLALSGVLGAIQAVAVDTIMNAFCAIRPPGHHAHDNPNYDGTCRGQGFCFLSNAAIAARYAQKHCGMNSILIVDWDYHHGNGTQDEFYDDPSVFFFSTHNYNAYPRTGNPALRGKDAGLGYNLNVHLNCGATDHDLANAFDRHLFLALDDVDFKPDLILISAGFDSQKGDWLGCFDITPAGFAACTAKLIAYAHGACRGKIVSILEGGYADRTTGTTWNNLASSAEAHVKTLIGKQVPEEYAETRAYSMR